MTSRTTRTALLVCAPLVAVAILMVGLRIGAGEAVFAASVFAAPPGRPAATGDATPIALQLLTYYEERSVRETVAKKGLVVVARSNGKEARWSGDSNVDGIAEANLTLAGFSPGHPLHVEVLAEGERAPLASGEVRWNDVSWGRSAGSEGRAAARPSKRAGEIGLDVLVEGERLVPGFETSLWIRATPADRALTFEIAPEPGLRPARAQPTACPGGWAELPVVAEGHVVGIGITARAREGARVSGEWFGPLPVAPGAFSVEMPRIVAPGAPSTVVLIAPNPRHVVYAEIDDEVGRVFAAALPVEPDPGDGIPRARLEIPALAGGLHWLVVSGEPRGAERLAGAAMARPFVVGAAEEACSIGPWLAQRPAEGFPRWLAVDGMAVRGAENRSRHAIGLAIGLVALLAAALLDVLLLVAASREARAINMLADVDDATAGDAERPVIGASPPGGGLAIALLLAVLGFALLAVLLVAKG